LGISLSTVISFPHPFLAYLIYSSDGQNKEPQRQHHKQQRCQPATDPGASFDDASLDASDYVTDHGQYAECSTPSTATAAEG
jgi:hypothetical protein